MTVIAENSEGSDLPCFDVSVVEKGSTIPYTVPSFPMCTAMLQPLSVLLQWEDSPDITLVVFNGCLSECTLLNYPLPALARVSKGGNYPCLVEVSS